MANFDSEKKYNSQIVEIDKNTTHFCDKSFSKKFFITCCDFDLWFTWTSSFNSEKKYKKLSISFLDIDLNINKNEFLSIFWNIWPPWYYNFFKNNYSYISLIWIIRSNT